MEKKANKFIKDFPSTTLFLDDLSGLINIFNEVCATIEVRAGDYVIKDPKELEQLARQFPSGRFDNVRIEGRKPYISIDLRAFGIEAYLSDDSIEQSGIITKSKEIILKGKRLNPDWIALVIVSLLSFILLILFKKLEVFQVMVFVYGIAAYPVVNWILKNRVIIYTIQRADKKSNLKKISDWIENHKGLFALLGTIIAITALYLKSK